MLAARGTILLNLGQNESRRGEFSQVGNQPAIKFARSPMASSTCLRAAGSSV